MADIAGTERHMPWCGGMLSWNSLLVLSCMEVLVLPFQVRLGCPAQEGEEHRVEPVLEGTASCHLELAPLPPSSWPAGACALSRLMVIRSGERWWRDSELHGSLSLLQAEPMDQGRCCRGSSPGLLSETLVGKVCLA
jgi:hypothetical protein